MVLSMRANPDDQLLVSDLRHDLCAMTIAVKNIGGSNAHGATSSLPR